MDITTTFFLGFFFALIGVIPPGLLNMSAAKISLKEGHASGVVFSVGVCVVVILQTLIAAVFAKHLSKHPDVVKILQRVAFVIFVLLSVYFLVIAQRVKKPAEAKETRSKHSYFFQGLLLSTLNMFPIPYQAYVVLSLSSVHWMTLEKTSIASYVAGAAMGTFAILYVYIFFFDKIRSQKLTSPKSMNYLIGGITALVAVVTLVNIIKDW